MIGFESNKEILDIINGANIIYRIMVIIYQNTIFLGLEYVIEIEMESHSSSGFCYTCRLCNNMLHDVTGSASSTKLKSHLQSFQHRSKYIVSK